MPVTAIVAAVTIIVAAVGVTATTAAIITTLVTVGAALAEQALSKRNKDRNLPLENRPIMTRNQLVPRVIPYGRTRIGANWVYTEVYNRDIGGTRDTDNIFMSMVLVFADGPIEAFESIYFGNTRLELEPYVGAHEVETSAYSGLLTAKTTESPDFHGRVVISQHLGDIFDSEKRRCTFNTTNNTFNDPNSNIAEWEMVRFFADEGSTLPTGIVEDRDYFTIRSGTTLTDNDLQITEILPRLLLARDPVFGPESNDLSRPVPGQGTAGFGDIPRISLSGGSGTFSYQIMRESDKVLTRYSRNWTGEHRLRGVAYLHIVLEYIEDLFPNGQPMVSAVVRGRKDIPDANGQNLAYRTNAALCLAHYITLGNPIAGNPMDRNLPVLGIGAKFSDIDQPALAAAAAVCDCRVPLKQRGDVMFANNSTVITSMNHQLNTGLTISFTGSSLPSNITANVRYVVNRIDQDTFSIRQNHGSDEITFASAGTGSFNGSEPMYECNGTIHVDDIPEANLVEFRECMGGTLTYTGGKYRIFAGEYRPHTFTITQDMIIDSVQMNTRPARRDKANRVKGTFIGEAVQWQATDFPAREIADDVRQDGEVITKDLEFSLISSPYQCERVANIELNKSRAYGRQINLRCNVRCLTVSAGDIVTLDFPGIEVENIEFLIIESAIGYSDDLAWYIDLTLKETNAAIYEWDAERDQINFDLDSELKYFPRRSS